MKKQDPKKEERKEARRQKRLAKQTKTAQTAKAGKKGTRNKKAVSYELSKKGPKSLNALLFVGNGITGEYIPFMFLCAS